MCESCTIKKVCKFFLKRPPLLFCLLFLPFADVISSGKSILQAQQIVIICTEIIKTGIFFPNITQKAIHIRLFKQYLQLLMYELRLLVKRLLLVEENIVVGDFYLVELATIRLFDLYSGNIQLVELFQQARLFFNDVDALFIY